MVVEDIDAHGGKAVIISRDFFNNADLNAVDLYSISLLPGDYQVKFRLKVADNQEQGRVAELIIHHSGTNQFLLNLDIVPSDFHNANKYQDFVVPLSLARMTDDIEIQIVYDGGMADLYIDTIETEQDQAGSFPFFACVGIDNIGEASAEVPGGFIQEFESRGGVVLHPDEFIAALNPEYMIELAMPLLGAEHAVVNEAQQQLEAGDYFNSLMTIRDALRVYLEHQREN